ncbi:hypothetical protein SRB5_12440 [Streptomyces sp. RB5]|uniref:Uncharacterized protein n=1 Tax=Streptomyces smaragdinus TaxID=2585196 RepID=A0A7K0CCF8_9ACTN|nr:hypothetical protein [Streptomyces smaragdinus]MQY11130.1 hypothetical protein [Streptomyces smaragdinus]
MQPVHARTATVTETLRTLERVLLRAGHSTARRNAWNAVLEDRRRARDRRETEQVMRATTTGGVRPT